MTFLIGLSSVQCHISLCLQLSNNDTGYNEARTSVPALISSIICLVRSNCSIARHAG